VPRVAAIGLDAAEWTLVERLLADGEMPHLERLRARSAVAQLQDPADYRTGLVWEHFLTGRGAASNMRWAAVEFDPLTYEVWQEGARPTTPFYVSDPPLPAVIFDVPYTTLGHEVDGAVVVGWGGHDPGHPRASLPAGLLDEIDARFGPHPAFANDYEPIWHRADAIDRLCDALIVGTTRRADAARWLLERNPHWELFVTVLSEPHSAGEHLWHGVDPHHPAAGTPTAALAGRRLREVYRAVDDALGRLLAGLPADASVVVFAMHGMGPNDADVASMVLLPELLMRLQTGRSLLRGPPAPHWDTSGRAPIVPVGGWSPYVSQFVHSGAPLATRLRGEARHQLRRLRPSRSPAPPPGGASGALGRRIEPETLLSPAEIGVPRSSVAWQIPMRYRRWWPKLEAFALPTFYDGRIRLNVRGRERDGLVDPADYTATCERLEGQLHACRDARTGGPLVERVDRLRSADPFASGGPDADLQVVWASTADALVHPTIGRIGPIPYRRTGGHSPNGFAFVSGPDIDTCDLGLRHAHDVTPTVLHLLGRPLPRTFDGCPLVGGGSTR